MARDGILFSIITPSTGRRPRALRAAVASIERAARFAGLGKGQLEILIGFDGVKGQVPECAYPIHSFNLPRDNDWGNGIRNTLIRIAEGEKLVFVDDDNTLKPYALSSYLRHFDTEIVIGRIDTQLTLNTPVLPVVDSGSLVRQGNIDPLCVCASRSLVADRCGGWNYLGAMEADYLNIFDWYRRAHSVTVIEDIVGVFDSGRSLDSGALSVRQRDLLDSLAAKRGAARPVIGRSGISAFDTAHA